MDNFTANSERFFNKRTIALIGVLTGIFLLVTAWFIDLFIYDLEFNYSGIYKIHVQNPVYWIIDIAPLVLGMIGFMFGHILEMQREKRNLLIHQKRETLNSIAEFAAKIGQGKYDAKLKVFGDNGAIGKALLGMRNSIEKSVNSEDERNWIMNGIAEIGGILRNNSDLEVLGYEVIRYVTKYIDAVQGAFYIVNGQNHNASNNGSDGVKNQENTSIDMIARYAYNRKKYDMKSFTVGQGLIGQCAFEKNFIYRTEIPDDYVSITSGLIKDKKPVSILLTPMITDEKLYGIVEFASIKKISPLQIKFVKELGEIVARTIFNIKTNNQTVRLLEESQEMSTELKQQQVTLKENAVEMKETQEQLKETNIQLESQIQEVKHSQDRLHALLERSSEIISIYDANDIVQYESPSVKNILGYTQEEMLGDRDFSRIHPKGQEAIREMFEKLHKNPDKTYNLEFSYLKKNGERIWLESTGRNLLKDPAINGIVLNSHDITERRRAEKEQRMRGQMQALSENSPDMIIRLDLDGRFFYVNPTIQAYTGITAEKLQNETLYTAGLNDIVVENWKKIIEEVRTSNVKIEKEMDFPVNGEVRIMNVSAIPEYNVEKELETVLLVSHDITERKKQELLIQETNKKITESINYAETIQGSILPSNRVIKESFPQSFIFYKPKDVVSGDFPWIFYKGDDIYIAAVDCTGHGVPGALMSLIGYFLLNDIVSHDETPEPAEVLERLHKGVVKTLRQDKEDSKNARDGMDIALCKINIKKNELHFSGAHRPLYFVRKGELTQYKGDKFPIGGTQYKRNIVSTGKKDCSKDDVIFTNHTIKLQKGDAVFFFSDGLPDQFGGPDGMKYGPKRVRELIVDNNDVPMPVLEKLFREDYENWKGNNKQIDDVLLIGIKF